MNLKKMLLPATLIAMIALLAPWANAQTMGEYATTTSGSASPHTIWNIPISGS